MATILERVQRHLAAADAQHLKKEGRIYPMPEVKALANVDEVARPRRQFSFVSRLETIFEGKPSFSSWSTGSCASSCVVRESDDSTLEEEEPQELSNGRQKPLLLGKYRQADSHFSMMECLPSQKVSVMQKASLSGEEGLPSTAEKCKYATRIRPSEEQASLKKLEPGLARSMTEESGDGPLQEEESTSEEEDDVELQRQWTTADDKTSSVKEDDVERKNVELQHLLSTSNNELSSENEDHVEHNDLSSIEDECEVERNEVLDDDESSIEDECDVEFKEVVVANPRE